MGKHDKQNGCNNRCRLFILFGFILIILSLLFTFLLREFGGFEKVNIFWIISAVVLLFLFVGAIFQFFVSKEVDSFSSDDMSEEKFDNLLHGTDDWVWEVGSDGKYLYVSNNVINVLGFNSSELLGKYIWDLSSEEKQKTVKKVFENCLQRKENMINLECWMVGKEGQKRLVVRNATPFMRGGVVAGFRGIDRDISYTYQKEKELEKAYDIINRSPVVVFLWKNSQGWPVEYVSENVQNLFGYSASEFRSGQISYAATVHPEDLARVTSEVVNNSKDSGIISFRHNPYRIINKTGAVKYVDDMTYIRRNKEGAVTHYDGIILDITDRKRLEQNRDQLQMKMIRADKLASIGEMAARFANEIITPLSMVEGVIRRIRRVVHRKDFNVESVDNYFGQVEEILRQITTQVAGLRFLSADKGKSELENIKFSSVIRDVLDMSMEKFTRSDININFDFDKNMIFDDFVEGKRIQLIQVINGLINNAYDSVMLGGEKWVKILLVDDQTHWTMSIVDGGQGLRHKGMEKIDHPFYTNRSSSYSGGLGLGMMGGIVENMGGELFKDDKRPKNCYMLRIPKIKKQKKREI